MTKIRWIIFAFIAIAVLGGLVYLSRSEDVDVGNVEPSVIAASDHVYGNPESKVILFEYGDFQCSACGAAWPAVAEVKEKYKDQIAFVYRHFPLTAIHPNALSAATAAEAANKQGKFYEMHDQLFANQKQWENAGADTRGQIFESYAQAIGLNVDQFKQDFTDASLREKIDYDLAIGQKLGVNSTPTFYLNGEQLSSNAWQDIATLEQLIKDALQNAGVALPEEE
jgi:protein-disulfide isomerase